MRFVHGWCRVSRRGGEHSRAAVVGPWCRGLGGWAATRGAAATRLGRAAARRCGASARREETAPNQRVAYRTHCANVIVRVIALRVPCVSASALQRDTGCSHLLDKSCLSTDLSEKQPLPCTSLTNGH